MSTPTTTRIRQFASDNYAGICPEAWAALADANSGHAPAYGEDPWTARAANLIREVFQTDCEVFFVFNGTAGNSLSLATLCQSYHSVICSQDAHIETDECGAPEFFSNGTKILTVDSPDGKITPDAVQRAVTRRTDIHYPKPRVVSVTNATELGTAYTPAEVHAISHVARQLGLYLHLDGARLANAIASLDISPAELTWKSGVDVLSLGATKNGSAVGDAVVFFNNSLAHEFEYRCKQAGQLSSKMRFLSAPWVGLLTEGAWLRNARHANAMAQRLHVAIRDVKGLKILFPRQANCLFVQFPEPARQQLYDRGWKFYNFIGPGACRLMCSWDTTEEDVDAFAADIAACTRG